jgi:UV DNA damage endonuclease
MNPFVQLGSPNPDIVRRSVFDIMMYYNCARAMRLQDCCVVLHIGGVYGDKRETMKRWLNNYKQLPAPVRKLIVVENDERHYGAQDLLPFCEINKIPFCFDAFHNSISHESVKPDNQFLHRVIQTWGASRPKFHLSEQAPGAPFGTHSKMVKHIPEYLLRLKNVDIMIEAKNKELAVLKLMKRYTINLQSAT